MKKFIVYLTCGIIVLFLACLVLFDFNKKDKSDKNLEKVTLAEVAHTIFYAPQYVALEKGYFEDYGIDINLTLTAGADKVTAAVLSGDADIGFCGSEATIYVYKNGEKDYLKTFAQLTQKDGTFLVSKKKIENFKLDDLKGKTVIGGRAGVLMSSFLLLSVFLIYLFVFEVIHKVYVFYYHSYVLYSDIHEVNYQNIQGYHLT